MTQARSTIALAGALAAAACLAAGPAIAKDEQPKPQEKSEAATPRKDCAEGYHMVGGRCLRDPGAKPASDGVKPADK